MTQRRGRSSGTAGSWRENTSRDAISLAIDDDSGGVGHATDPKMQEVDLHFNTHQRHTTHTPPPRSHGSGASSASQPSQQLLNHQQYASMLYQKTSVNEESLRRFTTGESPLNISSSQIDYTRSSSPASTTLLTKWKLEQQTATTRLEDYHTVFRTPLHVPDCEYEAYLLGLPRRKDTSIITKPCCASICAGFSLIGMLFLLFIGILLDKQPLYIPGTLPELVVQSTFQYKNNDGDEVITYTKPVIQYLVPGPADERLPIASTAYQAAAAYFVTFVASLYVLDPTRFAFLTKLFVTRHLRRRSRDQYESLPDYDSSLPTSSFDSNGMVRSSSSYQPGVWNRATGSVKRWLAVRGWYRVRRRNKNKKKG